VKRILF